jgi:hypothetical protein
LCRFGITTALLRTWIARSFSSGFRAARPDSKASPANQEGTNFGSAWLDCQGSLSEAAAVAIPPQESVRHPDERLEPSLERLVRSFVSRIAPKIPPRLSFW